jgi:HEAT repeat protein
MQGSSVLTRVLARGLCVVAISGCASQTKESNGIADAVAEDVTRILAAVPFQSGPSLVEALHRIASYEALAVPPLVDGLRHEHPGVRSASAYVLGQLGDSKVIDPLRALAQDPDAAARYEAATARLALGDWTSVPLLIHGLRDENRVLRYKCFEILAQATGLTFGYDFASTLEDRERAADRWQDWWTRVSEAGPVDTLAAETKS